MNPILDQQSIATLIVGASAKLDVLWQIFIGVHVAIFGLLLIHRAALRVAGKLMAMVGYLLVSFINVSALSGTYNILNALHRQFRRDFVVDLSRIDPQFLRYFVQVDLSDRPQLLIATHGIALVIVFTAIFFSRSVIDDSSRIDGGA